MQCKIFTYHSFQSLLIKNYYGVPVKRVYCVVLLDHRLKTETFRASGQRQHVPRYDGQVPLRRQHSNRDREQDICLELLLGLSNFLWLYLNRCRSFSQSNSIRIFERATAIITTKIYNTTNLFDSPAYKTPTIS